MEDRIRRIEPRDDEAVADIVREVMREFDCAPHGCPSTDLELAAISAAYSAHDARFYVVERGVGLVGCGGFARLDGGASREREATCELRRMYLARHARGCGLGARLLDTLLDGMRAVGYRRCYLETASGMEAARGLYRSRGFVEIDRPAGRTTPRGCDRYFALALDRA